MLSRRHFKAIANALNYVKPDDKNVEAYKQWVATCQSIASTCSAFNSNFNRAQFLAACVDGC